MGVVLTLHAFESLWSPQTPQLGRLSVLTLFLLLNAGITASGILFVQKAGRTSPLLVALAIQIPSISSRFFAYKFAAGIGIVFSIMHQPKTDMPIRVGLEMFYGNWWTFSLFQKHPFSLGINLCALTMLILLWRATNTKVERPTQKTGFSADGSLEPSNGR